MTKSPHPSYHQQIDRLVEVLRKTGSMSVLLVDLSDLSHVEQDYGHDTYASVMAGALELLAELQGTAIRSTDLLAASDHSRDALLIFPDLSRDDAPMHVKELQHLAHRVEAEANQRLTQLGSPFVRRRPSVIVGYSVVVENPLVGTHRAIERLVESAWGSVALQRDQRRSEQRHLLEEVLLHGQIRIVHQPIVELERKSVLGYEALTRGAISGLESPGKLFELAARCDLVFELDRLCRRMAFRFSRGMPRSAKVFINVLPSAVYDPDFRGEHLIRLLEPTGLAPEQIVLEITEKYAIDNYALFGEAVQSFTQMGFSIAVDDIGAGHSGLEKIAKLKPRFLKFDMSLVRNIDTSPVRREMAKAFKGFADKMGSKIIAEGVERREELKTLAKLGIDYGQGFLLGRPEPLFPG